MQRFLCLSSLMLMILVIGAAQSVKPGGPNAGRTNTKQGSMGLFPPDAIQWQDGPAALAPGTKMVILEGDPTKEGLFTMRLWFPDGFVVLPHSHTQIEHVTIISGTLNFGMGDKFDRSATRPMTAGTFGYWPPGMTHFAWTSGDTILQLHGKGPWTVTYVNPVDDPRNKKK